MWSTELGEIYESYQGTLIDRTPTIQGVKAPQQANPGNTYNNNKLGTATPNIAAQSLAGNVQFGNPYEQEETIEGDISKHDMFVLIDGLASTLDENNHADRMALLVLGQLKTKIKKC